MAGVLASDEDINEGDQMIKGKPIPVDFVPFIGQIIIYATSTR